MAWKQERLGTREGRVGRQRRKKHQRVTELMHDGDGVELGSGGGRVEAQGCSGPWAGGAPAGLGPLGAPAPWGLGGGRGFT